MKSFGKLYLVNQTSCRKYLSLNCIFVVMIEPFDDTYFMRKALQEAEAAFEKGEIPVGAVVVIDNKIIIFESENLSVSDLTACKTWLGKKGYTFQTFGGDTVGILA